VEKPEGRKGVGVGRKGIGGCPALPCRAGDVAGGLSRRPPDPPAGPCRTGKVLTVTAAWGVPGGGGDEGGRWRRDYPSRRKPCKGLRPPQAPRNGNSCDRRVGVGMRAVGGDRNVRSRRKPERGLPPPYEPPGGICRDLRQVAFGGRQGASAASYRSNGNRESSPLTGLRPGGTMSLADRGQNDTGVAGIRASALDAPAYAIRLTGWRKVGAFCFWAGAPEAVAF